jgi:hypothetical protein
MYTIVLANTRREAQAWARQEGLSLRKIKFAQNSQSIAGRFYDRIIELPSYGKRRDKHAVNASIKRLMRSVKGLEITKLPDWVMPDPPLTPERAQITSTTWLLGDVDKQQPFSNGGYLPPGLTEVTNDTGETITVSPLVHPGQDQVADRADMDLDFQTVPELSTADLYKMALEQGAEIDVPEAAAEPLSPQQAERAQEVVAAVTESLEKIDDGLTEAGPKPKKKGRRTNEQKAYDEALAAWNREGLPTEELSKAREALAKRHPDDERLQDQSMITREVSVMFPADVEVKPTRTPKLNVPGVAQGSPDLDF